ncbi:MAG: selenium-dependent xanthine dehydrogenase [Spirochaetaceae bacterium]|nr:selenium-dependent xanthine dehydrogenase [Spirochaetaceae bacterium]
MHTFSVNGKNISTDIDKSLLRFLRENLKLYGSKDGCSEGVCGTCTVLIDGKKKKACVAKTSKLDGKKIVTIEGLSEREQDVYGYCFAKAGAVQCGFCTPGMVMSAKSLLDINLNPTLEEVRKCIQGNICRCTGYKKIEQAILDCARFFRENFEIPSLDDEPRIDMRYTRPDAIEKVLGKGVFTDDIYLDGMLFCKVLRSAYPRAKIVKLDLTKANKHPDCVYIATAKDVPENKLGHIVHDWDVLIAEGNITRYIGDGIAIIAATNFDSLDEIISLIDIEYEVLPVVDTIEKALEEDAPSIHESGNLLCVEHISRGNVDKAFAEAKYTVTNHYSVPYTEHAFMEVECAIAKPDGEGVFLYTSSQSIYDEQREISRMLKLPQENIHIQSTLVGGGFGGKEDMSVQHHAALMAYITKRPVKLHLTRQESLSVHPKRHPMEMDFSTCCDANGKIMGMKALILANTGAYASLGGPVLQRACTHASGPYNYQNIDVVGKAIYTNNVPSGAFRGFGVTQSCFAIEANLNLLAEKVGMDPFEFKYMNSLKPGDTMPNGQIAGVDCGIRECIESVRDAYYNKPNNGFAISFKNSGIGVGLPDAGRCILSIEDGVVHIRTSAACMGQGIATMAQQMLGETCNIKRDQVILERPDTTRTPDSGTSTASRQTVFTGEAIKRAATELKEALMTNSLEELEGREFSGEFIFNTDKITSTKEHPVSHVAYSYSAQVVELDEDKKVAKTTICCDVGTIVNPTAIEGQIEGGVAMGLGYCLTEDFVVDGGYLKVKYGTLGLLRSTQVPEIEMLFAKGPGKTNYSYGAKGIGELATIPSAPAAQMAYYKDDGIFRTSLPLKQTPYNKKKIL